MTMHEPHKAMSQDQHLQHLMEYVIQGWPESKKQLPQDITTHWTFRDNMAGIDGVVIKGKRIKISKTLQQQALKCYILTAWALKKLNTWHTNLFIK